MTVQEIVTHLDSHGLNNLKDDRKVTVINDVYFDVVSRELWPFRVASASVSTTGGQAYFTTPPADLGKVLAMIDSESGIALEAERLDRLAQRFSSDNLTSNGDPVFFYFVGNQIRLYPVPGNVRTIVIKYFRDPVELELTDPETDILLPPRHHRILVAGALSQLLKLEGKPDAAALYDAEFEHRLQTMREDLHTQQVATPDYIEAVDPDDWDY